MEGQNCLSCCKPLVFGQRYLRGFLKHWADVLGKAQVDKRLSEKKVPFLYPACKKNIQKDKNIQANIKTVICKVELFQKLYIMKFWDTFSLE